MQTPRDFPCEFTRILYSESLSRKTRHPLYLQTFLLLVKMTVFWDVAPRSLVELQPTRLHGAEDSHLHPRRRENLKYHVFVTILCGSENSSFTHSLREQ
jgi:hypothetical protein